MYYGTEGNKYTLVRTHIDSSDFSLGVYTAMSDPEDIEMKSFSLQRDEQYIMPLIRAVKEIISENLDLMLTPWSPPAFMKTNGDRTHGGKLKAEYRGFWAEYICRYIKEYNERGIKVNRVTIQNEPCATQTWDSCTFNSEEEKVFLRDFLYPSLIENGLADIKINIWDHNKERMYKRTKYIIDQDTDKMG